jgi:heat shock protein HtpX
LRARVVVAWNILKVWLVFLGGCVALAAIGWPLGGYRLASLLVFFGALVAAAAYWYADRVALGMVGARELPLGEAPALHAIVARLATRAGLPKPKLYLLPDGHPRALVAGRGPRGSAIAVSSPPRRRPSSRGSWHTSSRTSAPGTCSCRPLQSCSRQR